MQSRARSGNAGMHDIGTCISGMHGGGVLC